MNWREVRDLAVGIAIGYWLGWGLVSLSQLLIIMVYLP